MEEGESITVGSTAVGDCFFFVTSSYSPKFFFFFFFISVFSDETQPKKSSFLGLVSFFNINLCWLFNAKAILLEG